MAAKTKPKPIASLFPPPKNFDPAGRVIHAEFSLEPPEFLQGVENGRRAPRGAIGKGIRFERQGQEHLQSVYGEMCVNSPWLRFSSYHARAKLRWCQPDALLFDCRKGLITLVEFKLKHTPAAWWQTRHLYEPVVRYLFKPPQWRIRVCEIVRWYDTATRFPEKYDLVGSPEEIPAGGLGVLIWAKGRSFT